MSKGDEVFLNLSSMHFNSGLFLFMVNGPEKQQGSMLCSCPLVGGDIFPNME